MLRARRDSREAEQDPWASVIKSDFKPSTQDL